MLHFIFLGDAVGADPSLIGAQRWLDWRKGLSKDGITLQSHHKNLIDDVWTSENGRKPFTVNKQL